MGLKITKLITVPPSFFVRQPLPTASKQVLVSILHALDLVLTSGSHLKTINENKVLNITAPISGRMRPYRGPK